MSNIEVGEYVRTKTGLIDKVIIDYNGKCNNPNCNYKHISCETNYYNEDNIVKHSKNIIDLIEVGDYVNGKEVYSIGTSIGDFPIISYKDGTYDIDTNIKSIVTKEQFKKMEYKID